MPELQEFAGNVWTQIMSILGERIINQITEVFPILPFQWKTTQKGSFTNVQILFGFLVQPVLWCPSRKKIAKNLKITFWRMYFFWCCVPVWRGTIPMGRYVLWSLVRPVCCWKEGTNLYLRLLERCHGGTRWAHGCGAQGTQVRVIDTRRGGGTPGWSLMRVY